MITIYLVVFNVFFNVNILRIIFIINSISKALTFSKGICFGTIYKYIDIFYIIIDFTKTFITIAATSTTISKLFITT